MADETDPLLQGILQGNNYGGHSATLSDVVSGADHNSWRQSPPFAHVEFLNLEENQQFFKIQSRKNGVPRQIVRDGKIKMRVTYGPDDLFAVKGWIRRHPDAAKHMKLLVNPESPILDVNGTDFKNLIETTDLNIISEEPLRKSQEFTVDLGDIYNGAVDPFKLERTDVTARNRFQLIIQPEFFEHMSKRFYSPCFRCRTKPNPAVEKRKADTPSDHVVRVKSPRTDVLSPDSGIPDSPYIPSQEAIFESLEAKTAKIEDLVVHGHLEAPLNKADIAYYLKLSDEELENELEEGDIVGFFTDEYGETEIRRLLYNNLDDAVHAGVVSRSHYIAANRQPNQEGRTDTVCIIGKVNVKVVGSVENGERVYVSMNFPGYAIPQSCLPVGSFLRKKHVLLGIAMEKKTTKDFEKPQLVRCFVCIVLDVSRKDVLEEIEVVYESVEISTREQIKVAQRKTWKRLRVCYVITFIFLALLAFLLYQVLAPGSLFRYWLCRQGSIPHHDVYFTYTPIRDRTRQYNVHGILFSYEKILRKISENVPRNTRNDTGGSAYYFLNIDRCAYSGDYGELGNHFGGFRSVGGGKVLSIDHNCQRVYWYGYYEEEKIYSWVPYNSTVGLRCTPNPPYNV